MIRLFGLILLQMVLALAVVGAWRLAIRASPPGLAASLKVIGQRFNRFATWLSYPWQRGAAFFFLLSLLCSIGITAFYGIPAPKAHDEFSFLLQTDTFLHGRLANPTPQFPEHFENFHVLVRPSYSSKYFPGLGLVMAAGQLVTGQPIVGVWLTTALACAALFWCLRGALPPLWSFLGTLLVTTHPMMLYGSNNYYGAGCISVLGSAWVFGAILRILRGKETPLTYLTLSAGIAVLAIARPFEGFVFTAFAGIYLIVTLARQGRLTRTLTRLFRSASIACLLLPLLATGIGLAIFNRAVTGSPAKLPYAEFTKQYDSVPLFVFQSSAFPMVKYGNNEMQNYYTGYRGYAETIQKTPVSLAKHMISQIPPATQFFHQVSQETNSMVGAAAFLPGLLVVLGARGSRRPSLERGAAAAWIGFTLTILTCTYMQPHYTTPAVAAMAFIGITGLRRLAISAQTRGGGRGLMAMFLVAVAAPVNLMAGVGALTPTPGYNWAKERVALVEKLKQEGKPALVLVRYTKTHGPYQEWTYNLADLEKTPVVFARYLTEAQNQRLVQYYRSQGRTIYLLDVQDDLKPPVLQPFTDPAPMPKPVPKF